MERAHAEHEDYAKSAWRYIIHIKMHFSVLTSRKSAADAFGEEKIHSQNLWGGGGVELEHLGGN